jgi:hypothetical protein
MIETTAIRIGTIARAEANTNRSTANAPSPPSTASSNRPGPSPSAPLSSNSASNPVRCTGAPATVVPLSTALAVFSAFAFSPNTESGSGGGYTRPKVVLPSFETNARSPVEA